MPAEDATPRASDTFLTWQAEAAQLKEMCSAAASGMRPAVFDMELWHCYQAMARLAERFEVAFKKWPDKPLMSFEEKSADIRALHMLKEVATAMIEARKLK